MASLSLLPFACEAADRVRRLGREERKTALQASVILVI
jgi:hypothetical protein